MRLDVIIPTKNCAADLSRCLESLRYQVEPVRVIVVDGRSTDATREVAELYGAEVYTEPPSEVKGSRRAVACNEGLRHVEGKYVAFLDADTVIPPTWSRDMARALDWVQPTGVGVTTGCTPSDSPYAKIMELGSPNHAKRFTQYTPLTSLPGYNSAYIADTIREVGGFCEELGGCEDFELNMRLRKAGYWLYGVPGAPVNHVERRTPEAWRKQVHGYGWSRGRLLRVKRQFTPQHSIPMFMLPLTAPMRLLFRNNSLLDFLVEWGVGYAKGLLN